MGKYEQIAFDLLDSAFGDRFVRDDSRIYSIGPDAGTGSVDGTIDGRIAVEIGVGSPKQIRASALDLALHPYPGKLLVLVDTPRRTTERSVNQAGAILERLGCWGVVMRLGEEVTAVDLSAVVSKWIEETEKHLARLFDAAESSGGVLVFDESDELFGKRGEAAGEADQFFSISREMPSAQADGLG